MLTLRFILISYLMTSLIVLDDNRIQNWIQQGLFLVISRYIPYSYQFMDRFWIDPTIYLATRSGEMVNPWSKPTSNLTLAWLNYELSVIPNICGIHFGFWIAPGSIPQQFYIFRQFHLLRPKWTSDSDSARSI